jgi:hypothetical protein
MSKRKLKLTRRMRKQPDKAQAEQQRREHVHQLRVQRKRRKDEQQSDL